MLQNCRHLVESGNLAEAELRLIAYLQSNPKSAEASALLGIVYAKAGKPEQAGERLQFALAKNHDNQEALTWLAVVRKSQNHPEEAVSLLRNVLAQTQDDPEIWNLLGICLLSLGQAREAEAAFRSALGLQPDSAPAYANLGMALRLQNRGEDALEPFRRAVALAPGQAQNHLQLFKQLQQLSRWDEAVEALQIGLQVHPQSTLLTEALALAYGRMGRKEEAESLFKSIEDAGASAANSYATWLQDEGRFEDSISVLEHSLRLQPIQGAPYRQLVEAKQFTIGSKPMLEIALNALSDPRLDDAGRMHLSYALGKLYEREHNYEAAMRSYDVANATAYRIYPASRTFDPARTEREPQLAAETYTRQFLERLAETGSHDPGPIFIVGMIRSGTTLLDQIVSSHPAVVSVGEGTFWNSESDSIQTAWARALPSSEEIDVVARRYLNAVMAPANGRFIDKMPLNYRHLGLIHAVFPNAHILHIRRDAFDTCLSIYTTFFGGGPNFAYNQANIVSFYQAYLLYREHWRTVLPPDCFFELDYESLVSNPARLTRDVLQFLNLPWDEACLSHQTNRGQVSTPSRWQARQPIYTSSVGKRQNYGPYAGALNEL